MSAGKNNALQTALDHLDNGDWGAAHKIVQNHSDSDSDDSPAGCWLHGIVHVMEGDLDNARYWYDRAGRVFSQDVAQETAALRKWLA